MQEKKKKKKKKPKSKHEIDANHQVYTLLMDTLQNRMIGMMIFVTLNKFFWPSVNLIGCINHIHQRGLVKATSASQPGLL